MIVKHSKRTIRKPCHACGSTELYWAHDTEKHTGRIMACDECKITEPCSFVLINTDGSLHKDTCGQAPKPATKPDPAPMVPRSSATGASDGADTERAVRMLMDALSKQAVD